MYNPFTLEGKTILVTGAGGGIGRATAIACSKMGATLVVTDINAETLAETLSLLETEADRNQARQETVHACPYRRSKNKQRTKADKSRQNKRDLLITIFCGKLIYNERRYGVGNNQR